MNTHPVPPLRGQVNSEEGFPNIERVSTYPAHLTEDGGVERIGPVEVISEADPNWNQWDQDQ